MILGGGWGIHDDEPVLVRQRLVTCAGVEGLSGSTAPMDSHDDGRVGLDVVGNLS